jgi:peptidyl-tRNA hydrolase
MKKVTQKQKTQQVKRAKAGIGHAKKRKQIAVQKARAEAIAHKQYMQDLMQQRLNPAPVNSTSELETPEQQLDDEETVTL